MQSSRERRGRAQTDRTRRSGGNLRAKGSVEGTCRKLDRARSQSKVRLQLDFKGGKGSCEMTAKLALYASIWHLSAVKRIIAVCRRRSRVRILASF